MFGYFQWTFDVIPIWIIIVVNWIQSIVYRILSCWFWELKPSLVVQVRTHNAYFCALFTQYWTWCFSLSLLWFDHNTLNWSTVDIRIINPLNKSRSKQYPNGIFFQTKVHLRLSSKYSLSCWNVVCCQIKSDKITSNIV